MPPRSRTSQYESYGFWPPNIYALDEAGSYARDSLIVMVNNGMTYFDYEDGDTGGVYCWPKVEMDRGMVALFFGDFYRLVSSDVSISTDTDFSGVTSWIEFG